ncbi:conserved hypothetical protein [Tenacibaculum litopenaei]|uniref:hypothetical protein n=1 Tax=Tenacibaculum litopenaei TaxID=396016 RepID=UPI0038956D99
MNYYSAQQKMTAIGVYAGYHDGNYTFVLENNEVIDFDQINTMILEHFDLKSTQLKGTRFEINYIELIDDVDDEDYISLKLNQLTLV